MFSGHFLQFPLQFFVDRLTYPGSTGDETPPARNGCIYIDHCGFWNVDEHAEQLVGTRFAFTHRLASNSEYTKDIKINQKHIIVIYTVPGRLRYWRLYVMDQRMQDYWKQRRESLVVDIQSLEKATEFKPVTDQEWSSLDRKAIRLLSKLKREAVATLTRNAWKLWRQFGRHTISTVWSLRRVVQSNVRPRLMLCVGKIARPEYPFTVYELGLKGKNVQRTLWVSGLDQDRLSESMPFLWIDFVSSGTVMCRIYPETDTTPVSTIINRDLGVNLETSIPLNGLVPIAFRDHLRTIRPLFESFIDLARRDDRHRRMLYKLKCLHEELQRFDRTEKKWDT